MTQTEEHAALNVVHADEPQRTAGAAPERAVHLTLDDRSALGRAARRSAPRTSHATFEPEPARDPVGLLDADTPQRVQDLVPIRYGRMLVSPFTFFRGAATVMAHDLATTPRSGLDVQLCGDAHLANFGAFASPDRALVFDLNDFDETHRGPFEWDLKRLATSFEIAGRARGFSRKTRREAVLAVVRAYRETMQSFAGMRNLDVWYARLDVSQIERDTRQLREKKAAKTIARGVAKARTKDSLKAFAKLTETVDGGRRIVADPPLIVPIEDLLAQDEARDATQELRDLLRTYRRTLQGDRRRLLESFRYVHFARKVVGVGSVGTRCWIMLLLGRDLDDPLFLQIKEAGSSVLEPVLGRSPYDNHGQRIVEGQRLMQATSDIFLGWVRVKQGIDGLQRDFYVRQLWDWKASVDFETILPEGLMIYAKVCGWTLARAHARSGDRVALASYLGQSETIDRALAEFATTYADANERDYEALVEAARSGRIQATEAV